MIGYSLRKRFFRLLGTMALVAAGSLALAAPEDEPLPNQIERLDVIPLQGGRIAIKLGLNQALQAPPAGFTINNPPRIALDFPGTANALGKSAVPVGKGVLRSLNIVQAGSRTRLVVNLTKPIGYETAMEGKTVTITLMDTGTASTTTNLTTRFAEAAPGAQKHALREVDFRRGSNGEGRVVVDLADAGTGIDIRTQGNTVIVDFLDTTLPRNLERRLDVVDFATPVQKIDTFTQGANVRMIIESKGLWEHSVYQTDRQFILDVKPIIEDPNKLVQGSKAGYSGEKLSLNFQNVEVRAVLQVIADFTGLNIITSDSVGGNLTLRLKDVPWDQALDIILHSKGLSMRKSGNVIWIAPTDELATKEKLELEARQQISELEPVRTETFRLKYQKAEEVKKILGDEKQKILSKRGSVVVDARTNTLFVQDTTGKLEDVRRLINQIDVPVKQVLIEARIVEATDNFSKSLGARLGLHDQKSRPDGSNVDDLRANIAGSLDDTGLHTGQIDPNVKVPFEKSLSVNMAAASLGGFTPGSIAFSIFKPSSTRFLNLELSALQADGKGKIISNPRVVTADQMEAVIEDGSEIPYAVASSSGATSIQFKKATLSLRVKPQITPDDNIIMDLKVNKDSQGVNTTAGPAINTKQITTQVLVENGGTVVIGGIYGQEKRNTITKVPLLGDVPVLGYLFKNRLEQDDNKELLIFVTPKILKESLNIR